MITSERATHTLFVYPPVSAADASGASYPRLAEELRRIGAPRQDWQELFGRMVFNAMVGNDDDHCRNHAVIYRERDASWRLSPAFDVVPSTEDTPRSLQLQLCRGRRDISRDAILTDYQRFGFHDIDEASRYLDDLIERITAAFAVIQNSLPPDMVDVMRARVDDNRALLLNGPYPENLRRHRPQP